MSRRSKTRERARQERPAGGEQAPASEPVASPLAFEEIGLRVLVFVAGAVLMGLEIAGSRVLAPHFGNSVFVWGSLISVFLIALSVGYYVGGRLADRRPSRLLLNSICTLVSLWIFAIAVIAQPFCELLVQMGLGEQSGPLAASMVLFLPPSVGMGMVSPFAVRLATQSVSSVGKIAGTLYALSTAGSIVGTLATTFLLIPLVGLAAILKGLGLVLLAVSVLSLPFWRRTQSVLGVGGLGLLAVICLMWPVPPRTALGQGETLVVDVDTPYHHIAVVDNGIARQLRFDRFVESTVATTPPYPGLSVYTDYFHLAFLVQPKIRRTLFIGAGWGIGPRAFHQQDPAMAIDVVDIDPKVLDLAHRYFFLDRTPQIRTVAEDGRMFVRKSRDQYDCVVLDAFTIGGRIPFHLVTREFLALCRQRMTAHGVLVMNLNSAVRGPSARIFQSMYRTMASVFPNTYVFAVDHRQWGLERSMNVILVATQDKARLSPEQWAARARRYRSNCYVTGDRVRQMAGDLLVDLPDLRGAPLFSDDYAPIETMPF